MLNQVNVNNKNTKMTKNDFLVFLVFTWNEHFWSDHLLTPLKSANAVS